MLLDAGSSSCNAPEQHPYISVTASYNALDHRNPKVVLDEILKETVETLASDPPKDLAIAKTPSTVVKSNSRGWMTIRVVSQGEVQADSSRVAPVNYFAVLHTKSERLDRDLPLLRRVLNDIKLFSPE
jgi:hypothetical protein